MADLRYKISHFIQSYFSLFYLRSYMNAWRTYCWLLAPFTTLMLESCPTKASNSPLAEKETS